MMNCVYIVLFLSLTAGLGMREDSLYFTNREAICKLDGKSFTEGQTHTPNACLDVCLCEDDGRFHCKICRPLKEKTKCSGWAHQLNKVKFHVGTKEGGGCDCFKYECHKKSIKTLLKELWNKLKIIVKGEVGEKSS